MAKTSTLDEMTVEDLRERAKREGIGNTSHMRKDELIEALEKSGGSRGGARTSGSRSGGSRSGGERRARTTRGEVGGTDAIALLTQDHRAVEDLFDRALDLEPDDPQLGELAQQIVRALTLHTQVEEQLFYPALKDAAQGEDDDAVQEVLEAFVEHGSVKDLIAKLGRVKPTDESFLPILQVMSEQVEHHVEEEEGEMFDQARQLLGEERLAELGEQIAQMKQKAGG